MDQEDDQNHMDGTKIPWDRTNFFGVDQKKGEIDWTIGLPRDWPKPNGRDYGFWLTKKKNWSTKKMRTWFLVDQKKIGQPK